MAANQFRVVCRAFSTAQAHHQLVKTPVQVFGTEGRYASALYSAATKQKKLDAVEKDLLTFQAVLKKDTRFAEFLHDPSIKKTLKAEGLNAACDKLKLSQETKNLLACMGENGRYNLVDAVIGSFKTLMAAHRGEVVCEVITAKAIEGPMQKEIEGAIASFLKKGEKSLISYKVDPSIMGGMIVSIGDRFVDMSMASKMKKYTALIQAAA